QSYRQIGDAEGAAREFRAYLREQANAPNRAEVEKLIAAADAAVAGKQAAAAPIGLKPPTAAALPAAPPGTPACERDCGALSWNYHEGIGVPKDYTKAAAIAARGCESGDHAGTGSCQALGFYFELGHGLP